MGGKKRTGPRPASPGTKDRIVLAATGLLEERGYHGFGLAELLAASAAPKGSLYYHFPGGKEEVAAQAVLAGAEATAGRIRGKLDGGPGLEERFLEFVAGLAAEIEAGDYTAGGPLTIVASETSTGFPLLNEACRKAYDLIREAFMEALFEVGHSGEESLDLALTLCSALEGAIILARTYHRADFLDQVARTLLPLLGPVPAKAAGTS